MQPDTENGSANPGIVRPPFVYLFAVLVGLALDFMWPLSLPAASIAKPLGPVVILGALALFALAKREFDAAGTPVRGNRPAAAMVCSGPFRFSRNPIYLAFSLLQLGIAMWASSLWVLFMLLPAVALVRLVVIAREERYLEAKFGSAYASYKASVRRWL